MSEMRLYDQTGARLYLTPEERADFLAIAATEPPDIRMFAETLAYTGARVSEVLELVPERVNLDERQVVLRSLKKRREDVFRAVPVPDEYIDRLDLAFGVRKLQRSKKTKAAPIWAWHRQHGWRLTVGLMVRAGIGEGPHRTPKGLRHSYGIGAVINDVPLNMLQKWMGHAQISTTAIYANAQGKEERAIAARMWE